MDPSAELPLRTPRARRTARPRDGSLAAAASAPTRERKRRAPRMAEEGVRPVLEPVAAAVAAPLVPVNPKAARVPPALTEAAPESRRRSLRGTVAAAGVSGIAL